MPEVRVVKDDYGLVEKVVIELNNVEARALCKELGTFQPSSRGFTPEGSRIFFALDKLLRKEGVLHQHWEK